MTRNSNILPILFAIIVGCMILLAFIGCKTTIPAITTNTHESSRDSIRTEYKHDSIYTDRWHTIYIKGDTVHVHDSIIKEKYKTIYIHDSIDNSRIDTIYQTVQVEKPYKQFLVNSGVAFWILLVLIVIAVIIGIIIKFAK